MYIETINKYSVSLLIIHYEWLCRKFSYLSL